MASRHMAIIELVLDINGTLSRKHIVVEPSFGCLVQAIQEAHPNIDMEQVILKYIDDDGDLCTLIDATFEDFLRCLPSTTSGSQGILFVELSSERLVRPTLIGPFVETKELEEWLPLADGPSMGPHSLRAKKGMGKCNSKDELRKVLHGIGAGKGKGKCKGKRVEEPWEDFHGKGEEKEEGKGEHVFEKELWLWALKGKGKGPKGEYLEGWWHSPEEPWWEPHGKGVVKGKGKCKGKHAEEPWEDFRGKGEKDCKGKGKHTFEEDLWLWALKGKGKGQKGEHMEEGWHGPEEPWCKPHGKGVGKGKCKGKDFEEPWEDVHGKGEEKGKGKGKDAFEEQSWALKGKGRGMTGEDFEGWHGPEESWWERHCKGAEKGKGKGKGKGFGEPWPDFHSKGEIKGKGKGKFSLEDELWEIKGKGKAAFKGKGKGPWTLGTEEPWEEHDVNAWSHPWWDEQGKGGGKKGRKGKGKKGDAFEQSLNEDHWWPEMETIEGWRMDSNEAVQQEAEMTALHSLEEEEEASKRQAQHHQLSSL